MSINEKTIIIRYGDVKEADLSRFAADGLEQQEIWFTINPQIRMALAGDARALALARRGMGCNEKATLSGSYINDIPRERGNSKLPFPLRRLEAKELKVDQRSDAIKYFVEGTRSPGADIIVCRLTQKQIKKLIDNIR